MVDFGNLVRIKILSLLAFLQSALRVALDSSMHSSSYESDVPFRLQSLFEVFHYIDIARVYVN
jgi:hypothetical protein